MQINIEPLTQLTHNREASIRLFRAYQKRYSGKPAAWVLEKAREDLLRDRGVSVPRPLGPLTKGFPKFWRPRGSFAPIKIRPMLSARRSQRQAPAWLLVLGLLVILAWVARQASPDLARQGGPKNVPARSDGQRSRPVTQPGGLRRPQPIY